MTAVADSHLGEKRRSAVAGTNLSSNVLLRAIQDSFVKLDPRRIAGNPVILAVWIVALLASKQNVLTITSGRLNASRGVGPAVSPPISVR